MTDRAVTADREQLFATLADPATTGQFFERVSDSVSWTVEGTHPLAGTYTSKRAFFDSTFTILSPLTSAMATSRSAVAKTCAMPPPVAPAPPMAMCCICLYDCGLLTC